MNNQSYRILIIDDDLDIVSYLTDLLVARGYAVETAHTGEDGLAAMRAGSASLLSSTAIDLVILDVRIPEPDGYQVCRRAKADDLLQHIPIIMVTALGSKQNVTHGLEVGADDYVTKPFSPEELLARVKAMLRMRQMEREVLRHNRELATLNTIASVVSRSLDLAEVLPATLDTIISLLEMRAGMVFLLDNEDGQLTVRAQQGFSETSAQLLNETHWQVRQGIVGQVAELGQPALLEDLTGIEPWASILAAKTDTADKTSETNLSLLCVPLPARNRILGVLAILCPQSPNFATPDKSLVAAIGQQIGVSVENARLYTELRQFAQELERSQAQLIQAEKLAAMGRLTASIAHELNNPLQAVQNCLHLTLNRKLAEAKQRHYLTLAQEEVERLIDIVSRMLDFYRPSRGQRTPTDVNTLVENVLALRGDPNIPPSARNTLVELYKVYQRAYGAEHEARGRGAIEKERDQDREYHADHGDGLVLPRQVGSSALLNGAGDFLHAGIARVLLQDPAALDEAVQHCSQAAGKRDIERHGGRHEGGSSC